MTVENKNEQTNDQNQEKTISDSKQDDFVSRKVLEDFKKDFFKIKENYNQTREELEKLRIEKETAEREKLEKNQEWQKLYEKEKQEKEKYATDLKQKSEQFVNSAKINAAVQKMGGLKKNSYSKFIDPNSISLNDDGTINEESLEQEVSKFKQNFPELLKMNEKRELPSDAPKGINPTQKSVNDFSARDLADLASQLINKQKT